MRSTTTLLAALAVCFLGTGCRNGSTECYRDTTFEAMLQDTTLMSREWEQTQDTDSYLPRFLADWEQPLLCPPKADSLTQQMVGWFNTNERVNAIETDVDTYYRYYDTPQDDSLTDEMLACWRRITFHGIADTFTRRRLCEARNADTEEDGDPSLKDISDVRRYYERLFPHFDSLFFADSVQPLLTPQHYLPDTMPDIYETYVGRNVRATDEDVARLYNAYTGEEDFDTRMAYLFTLLGTFHFRDIDTLTLLLDDAEAAMQSGRYSPMLPLVWRAYRIGYTTVYSCPSTYCYVPNIRFNHFRRLVAYTYLRHMQHHPDDRVAKAQYYYLAWQQNINRFGDYMLGNQSGSEHIALYWYGEVL